MALNSADNSPSSAPKIQFGCRIGLELNTIMHSVFEDAGERQEDRRLGECQQYCTPPL